MVGGIWYHLPPLSASGGQLPPLPHPGFAAYARTMRPRPRPSLRGREQYFNVVAGHRQISYLHCSLAATQCIAVGPVCGCVCGGLCVCGCVCVKVWNFFTIQWKFFYLDAIKRSLVYYVDVGLLFFIYEV